MYIHIYIYIRFIGVPRRRGGTMKTGHGSPHDGHYIRTEKTPPSPPTTNARYSGSGLPSGIIR